MRWSLVLILLAVLVTLPAQSPAADSASAPVSVHFRNKGKYPIYLDATSHDGVIWPQALSTPYHLCGEGCDCFALSPPMPRVRVLAPGAELVSTWSGRYYAIEACTGNGPDCVCAQEKRAVVGTYEARVDGARGVRSDQGGPLVPVTEYQDWAVPDASLGVCHAQIRFELGADKASAAAPIVCDAPASR